VSGPSPGSKTGWAGGRPRALSRGNAQTGQPPTVRPSSGPPAAERLGGVAAEWAPVAGRALLGLVLIWFGFHELEHPGDWTGYVPVISETSNFAVVLVLIHGWVLFVLGFALVAGIETRLAAAVTSVLLLEIVISLVVTGLSATALRDVGVLGLAVCLIGCRQQRLVLRG
jgi:uncharacterized membrane protein YphA (DoxX/SURF4 family)